MRRAAAALLATVALAGCGLGAGEQQEGGAELRITRDFGHERLGESSTEAVREGQTIMRFLQSEHDVKTRFGGGFVQEIDGLEGSGESGKRDWFYFVNGIEADVGAAERDLHPGDVVHWDNRNWDGAMRVPAIVGAFPEPFRSGEEGKKIPTRVECVDPEAPVCEDVKQKLSDAGVVWSGATLGAPGGRGVLRVLVGRWEDLRRSRLPAVSLVAEGPEKSGVFARVADDGSAIELLDETGAVAERAPAGSGLLAATEVGDEKPVWIVTGLDNAGVDAAVAVLEESALRDAFAVAATPDGPVKLPVIEEEAGGS